MRAECGSSPDQLFTMQRRTSLTRVVEASTKPVAVDMRPMAESSIMPPTASLFLSATVLLASWGVCALSYATEGNVEFNAFLLLSLWVAAFISVSAAVVLVRAWRGSVSSRPVVSVSALAAVYTLWVAFLIALSNH